MKRKILSLVLALALVLPLCAVLELPVFAEASGEGWSFDEATGTLTVSSDAVMVEYATDGSDTPWVDYRDQITKIVIKSGVTKIGKYGFRALKNLEEVEIPNTVTAIANYAFYECDKLTTIIIPASVTNIGQYALGKTGLTKVVILSTQLTFAKNAFSGTTAIAGGHVYYVGATRSGITFTSTGGNKYFTGEQAVADKTCQWHYNCDVEEENGETHVYLSRTENNGFDSTCELCGETTREEKKSGTLDGGCTWALAEDGTLTIAGTGAMPDYNTTTNDPFHQTTRPWHPYLSEITKVVIEEGVTSVGELSFFSAEALIEVIIKPGVTTIGANSFQNCTSLTTFYLPQSVTSVGTKAFHQSTALANVYYEGSESDKAGISIGSYHTNLTGSTWIYNCCLNCKVGTYGNDYCHKCSECGEDRVVNPVITCSLVLENDLTMIYKIDADYFGEVEEGYFAENPTATFLSGPVAGVLKDGYYEFRYTNIDPSMMDDKIHLTLTLTYNSDVEIKFGYKVMSYCYTLLEDESISEELRALVKDLLRYGSAAQQYTGHNLDGLADRFLDAGDQGVQFNGELADHTAITNDVDEDTAVWTSAGLYLEKAVTLRFKFDTEAAGTLSVKIADENGSVMDTITDFTLGEDGKYCFYYDGLNPAQMRQKLNLTVYEGGNQISETLTYSVESYACAMQDDEAIGDLMKAMMQYGDSAAAYVA